ncbi:hypothetical protein H4582DRAFT_2051204 [Lactarius indigo]|nr:hypothetical protein H4582DRAFT_2051204 [Lactarius indigo]
MMGGSPATTPRDREIGRHLVTKRGSHPASQATQLIELGAIATALSDPAIFDFGQLFKAHHDPRGANAPALRALPEALKWQARRPAATVRRHHWGIWRATPQLCGHKYKATSAGLLAARHTGKPRVYSVLRTAAFSQPLTTGLLVLSDPVSATYHECHLALTGTTPVQRPRTPLPPSWNGSVVSALQYP